MTDVRACDGRNLRVHEGGDRNGFPVVVHHGTPATGRLFGPHIEDALRRGIRLIGYDRPGYGGSTPHPGRAVVDGAEDVAAIADALAFDRFATWGMSGGGAHALACAARFPDRVVAAASLAAVAPRDADGLDWLAGMGEANLEEYAAQRSGLETYEAYLRAEIEQLRTVDVDAVFDWASTLVAPVDQAVLDRDLSEYLALIWREVAEAGIEGWRDDVLEDDRPWGFRLDDIEVPVLLWHGGHDLFVPFAHGEWLAGQIPNVEAQLSEEDGHLTLFARRIPEVHAWLLRHV